MRRPEGILRLLAVLVLALIPGPAAASLVDTPPAGVVEVEVSAHVMDIVRIAGSEQFFEADIAFSATWKDHRLATGGATVVRGVDEIWTPRVTVANRRNLKTLFPQEVRIDSEGVVRYTQRIIGEFSCRLDLHEFPFDHQSLVVHLIARNDPAAEIRLLPAAEGASCADDLTISDWKLGAPGLVDAPYPVPSAGFALPGLALSMSAERHTTYYFGTLFASAAIILCMAWMVFWMPPSVIPARVSISVTSMLTLIAHRFVVAQELPRLPYLTRMDHFLLGAAFMVLLALVGVVVVTRVVNRGDEDKAERLNRAMRWTYPVAAIALLVTALSV